MRVNKRRREAEVAIADRLEAVVSNHCDRCGHGEEVTVIAADAEELACYFYDEGFRVVGSKMLCRKCRRRK